MNNPAIVDSLDMAGFNMAFKQSLERLDARTACGISPTAVRTPDGIFLQADSADEAFLVSRGFYSIGSCLGGDQLPKLR